LVLNGEERIGLIECEKRERRREASKWDAKVKGVKKGGELEKSGIQNGKEKG